MGTAAGFKVWLIPGTHREVLGFSPQWVRIWGGGSPNQTVFVPFCTGTDYIAV